MGTGETVKSGEAKRSTPGITDEHKEAAEFLLDAPFKRIAELAATVEAQAQTIKDCKSRIEARIVMFGDRRDNIGQIKGEWAVRISELQWVLKELAALQKAGGK